MSVESGSGGGASLSRRQLLRLSLLGGLGALAAACAGRSELGWTYGPTIAPSTGAPEPAAVPSGPAASAAASPSPSDGGAGS